MLQVEKHASTSTSTIGLVKSVIGLGTMTIPYAFSQGGLLVAIPALVIVIAWSNLMFRALAVGSDLAEKQYTFIGVARDAFGRLRGSRIFSLLCEICVIAYASGSTIAYIRCFGDFLPPLLHLLNLPDWVIDPRTSIVGVTLLVFPLTCMRTINALRWVSFVAMGALALCTTVVAMEFGMRGMWKAPEGTPNSWWLVMPGRHFWVTSSTFRFVWGGYRCTEHVPCNASTIRRLQHRPPQLFANLQRAL